jgi:hypothetical protein
MNSLGNVYSQFGEDQIIERIIDRISEADLSDSWACEFGAWDGLHLSNTANLIVNKGYKAVLIEAEDEKFRELKNNMSNYPVTCIKKFIDLKGENTLDHVLNATQIPLNFDVLSIDIDGADYWVLKSLQKYRPKVIVIEYNPTIPASVEFINQPSIGVNEGSSIRSLALLAKEMNYDICGITTCNLILVDSKYHYLFEDMKIEVNDIKNPDYVLEIWQTYDGKIHVSKVGLMLWHDVVFSDKKLQVIPTFLRKFPPNYSIPQKVLFPIWKFLFKVRVQ